MMMAYPWFSSEGLKKFFLKVFAVLTEYGDNAIFITQGNKKESFLHFSSTAFPPPGMLNVSKLLNLQELQFAQL